MTAVEKIIEEINNELQTLESLHGKEIFGRKVGLAFAKRVAEQAKEMEKQIIAQAFEDGDYNYFYNHQNGKEFETGIEYYNNKFKSE
jgi:hypothetical protein